MACNNSGVHERTKIWLIPHFMKKSIPAGLATHLSFLWKQPRKNVEEGLLTFYIKEASLLLETYATDDIIAETDNDIVHLLHPLGMSLLKFSEVLWMKRLRCSHLYGDYVLCSTSDKTSQI